MLSGQGMHRLGGNGFRLRSDHFDPALSFFICVFGRSNHFGDPLSSSDTQPPSLRQSKALGVGDDFVFSLAADSSNVCWRTWPDQI